MLPRRSRVVRIRPRCRSILGLVLVIILMGVLAQAANAHLYTGLRWRTMPVKYYIYPSYYGNEYRAAAVTWTNAPGSFTLAEVPNVFDSRHASWNEARFSQTSFPDDYYGVTVYYRDSQGYLSRADAYLNLDYGWSTNGVGTPDARALGLHEMGHWVYFTDSCTVQASVMCWQPGTIKRSLPTHDTQELSAVYP